MKSSTVLCIAAVCALTASVSAFEYFPQESDAPLQSALNGIGNGLWHSVGFYDVLPTNASTASSRGWHVQNSGACDSDLGVLYAQDKDGPSESKPLELWFTSAGQFAGFRVSIYGSSDTSSVGNAAQPQLLKAGFWKVTEGAHKTWHMSVSTRVPSQMCSGELQPELLGTQLVMNQDTIAISVPLSAREAQARGYAPGACIVGMGQHWEYDITLGNGSVSWVAGNLQPVVPMYYPPTIDGTIHAIFFTTPVAQEGSLLLGKGDWDSPAIDSDFMCYNFCQSNCHWNTDWWSTMHLYFNSDWKTASCPGGTGKIERTCPKD